MIGVRDDDDGPHALHAGDTQRVSNIIIIASLPSIRMFPAWLLLLLSCPGAFSAGNVTLESLVIFRTHEWLGEPTVYFRCNGEEKVHLLDVRESNHLYMFKGEESFQPLASLESKKCKRCGFYEEDLLKHDDKFDEWELCPDSFNPATGGRYTHFKEEEFNATFLCSECLPSGSRQDEHPSVLDNGRKATNKGGYVLKFLLVALVCLLVIATAVVGYSQWQEKKRQDQQARFIKLFEEDDDLEAELGL